VRIFWLGLRLVSLGMGFIFAMSFVRAFSRAFDWYVNRDFGWMLAFDGFVSTAGLMVSVGLFSLVAYCSKKPRSYRFYDRFDFTVMLFFCVAVFFACVALLLNSSHGFWFFIWGFGVGGTFQMALILLPFVAYLLAMFTFNEFIIRLRDKTLLPTLYWAQFFKAYPIWRGIGFSAALMLVCLLLMYVFIPQARLFLFLIVAGVTYFVAYMLDLAKEFDAANAEKIRAERFKSELITNVSHDIKTPLTSIINYVDLLKSESVEGKAAEYVQVLDKKSARLKALIEDLIEASKAGTGNLRVDMQEINLLEIIGQAAGEFEEGFTEKDLQLVLRQPKEAILVKTDSRHLYRALENLFSNASKYALGSTRVFAEVAAVDGRAHFTLQNTSEQPMDFAASDATEQFMRGDAARNTDGSGLGLYIAKSLVELVGGEFRVEIIGDLFRVEIMIRM